MSSETKCSDPTQSTPETAEPKLRLERSRIRVLQVRSAVKTGHCPCTIAFQT
jgi:hypothetical protein